MADRYQDRPFPTVADHNRGANSYVRGESEPLAELAQLIGQTDLFGTPAKPPLPLQSRANVRPQYAAEEEASAPAGPPPWRQRARREAPPLQPEQPSPVDPLLRYAAPPAAASEQNHHEPQQDTDEQPADPSRYDDALYGPIKSVEQENAHDPTYPDDPYAYQRDYEEEPVPRKRSGWVVTVAAVHHLDRAVVGPDDRRLAAARRANIGSIAEGSPGPHHGQCQQYQLFTAAARRHAVGDLGGATIRLGRHADNQEPAPDNLVGRLKALLKMNSSISHGFVIDGGYFENYGAQTAVELAREAVKAIEAIDGAKVRLVILQISSDPTMVENETLVRQRCAGNNGKFRESYRSSRSLSLINELSAPLIGIMSVRGAHGFAALNSLASLCCEDPSVANRREQQAQNTLSDSNDVDHGTFSAAAKRVFVHLAMCEAATKEHINPPLGWVLSEATENKFAKLLEKCGNDKEWATLKEALGGTLNQPKQAVSSNR